MRFSNKVKAFFTSTMEFVEKAKLSSFTSKKRIEIILTTLFLTIYCMVSFKILTIDIPRMLQRIWLILVAFIIIFFIILALVVIILKLRPKALWQKESKRVFLLFLLGSVIFMIAQYLYDYPISASGDVLTQYNQAITGEYNNWHPVAHTFLFYKIPILIFGADINNVLLFQYILIAPIIAYMGYSFYRFGVKTYIFLIATLLMFINSSMREIISFPWKDIPFSFAVLFFSITCMWIYFTKGEWIRKKSNVFIFALSALLILFMRHNGILVLIPSLIALLIGYKNERRLILLISTSIVAIYFIITIPIYSLLSIDQHPNSFSEAMGVANNQLSYIVKYDGNISDEELEFIDNIIPIEIIKSKYVDGDFNIVKWMLINGETEAYDGDFIEKNKSLYLKTWFSVVKNNFKLALNSYYHTTKKLWESNLSITNKITYTTGLAFYLATLFIFSSVVREKRKIIPYIPMLFNMIGIMMLVTGGEVRFVFANLTTSIPLIVFALTNMKDEPESRAQETLKNSTQQLT